jgi:hypothetical protein
MMYVVGCEKEEEERREKEIRGWSTGRHSAQASGCVRARSVGRAPLCLLHFTVPVPALFSEFKAVGFLQE